MTEARMSRSMRGALVALVAAVGSYEAVALWTPAPGDTISEVAWHVAAEWPIVTFLFGVLAGHLFWQRKR